MALSERQQRAAVRKERLAKQLRDNLKKRKQQTRARSSLSKGEDVKNQGAPGPTDEPSGIDPQNKDDE